MKVSQENKEIIAKAFADMRNVKDFYDLLDYVKKITIPDDIEFYPISRKKISKFVRSDRQQYYRSFHIPKKSGGNRTIHAPRNDLLNLQKVLNTILQSVYEPRSFVTGFIPDKSIIDNAKIHRNSRFVFNTDIKDFFPSIDLHRIRAVLKLPPFNLNGNREKLAYIISNLCCCKIAVDRYGEVGDIVTVEKQVLPQGAPTSPIISNIVAQKLDRRLNGLAKKMGARYSRYADDVTFSSSKNIFREDGEFRKELNRIITDQNYIINENKTRIQANSFRQEVTGLVVNDDVNVRRRYVKQLRMWLYYWETYGLEKSKKIFFKDYFTNQIYKKGSINEPGFAKSEKGSIYMVNVIRGRLEFLKMVRGETDSLYMKLRNRFDSQIRSIYPPSDTADQQVDSALPADDELDYSPNSSHYMIDRSPKRVKKKDNLKTEGISKQQKQLNELLKYVTIDEEISEEKENNNIKITIDPVSKDHDVLQRNIQYFKGTALPLSAYVKNEEETTIKHSRILSHNPLNSVDFLLKFKRDNDTGLKELVHIPDQESMDAITILEKVKNHPNLSFHFKKEKKPGFKPINVLIQKATIKLVEDFEEIGIPYYKKTGNHPFRDETGFGMLASMFKENYRIGPETEGYTNLRNLITNSVKYIFQSQSVNLVFKPDNRIFDLRANFYTWVPSLTDGLNAIIKNIYEHRSNDDLKTIEVEAYKDSKKRTIDIHIRDIGSFSDKGSDVVLQDHRHSNVAEKYFRSLCNWYIEYMSSGGNNPTRLTVLSDMSEEFKDQSIQELDSPVSGFNHILSFYNL